MSMEPTATTLQPGDGVRRRDGVMSGVVYRFLPSNPDASDRKYRTDRIIVDWDSARYVYRSTIAVARVEKIGARP